MVQPIRIETTCKVVFNLLFKKPVEVEARIWVLLREDEVERLPKIVRISGSR